LREIDATLAETSAKALFFYWHRKSWRNLRGDLAFFNVEFFEKRTFAEISCRVDGNCG
jgi:hypothetical protein